MFGLIHCIIGRFYKTFQIPLVVEFSETDAHSDVFKTGLFNGRTDSLANGQGLVADGTDEEDGKFVSSITVTGIHVAPNEISHNPPYLLQDPIPLEMAIKVIVLFEVIEIEHQ